jgi:predicted RND superfamily exporter protein
MEDISRLSTEVDRPGILLTGWPLLGTEVFHVVRANLWRLILPMAALVLVSLCFAFRRWREVVLSLAVLGLSALGLLTVMRWAGWSWNLLNLMALPLILGTGVDYGIFMQLALRRHRGNLSAAQRSVGRALLLCGGTAVAGFGSLAFSSNAGMASLGRICATGIGFNVVISVVLLPVWWKWIVANKR